MRILEISRVGLFKALLPSDTRWIRWGQPLTADEPMKPEPSSISMLARTLQQVVTHSFDLLVLPALHVGHLHDQSDLKLRVKSAFGRASSTPLLIDLLNRLVIRSLRHVILDVNDTTELCRTTMQMFPNYALYFKRELDLSSDLVKANAARVRPLSLFLPDERHNVSIPTKTVDVFFAGSLCNEVRKHAVDDLESLREDGFVVRVPTERLSYRDYLQCMAESWIVLSPEGYGWDCYRHYEAGFVQSVPLINYPTYPRNLFLSDQRHCIYYNPDTESVADKVRILLRNKADLLRIGAEARRHVLDHHTRAAVGQSMLDKIVAAAGV